jgi:hypothetical protein
MESISSQRYGLCICVAPEKSMKSEKNEAQAMGQINEDRRHTDSQTHTVTPPYHPIRDNK